MLRTSFLVLVALIGCAPLARAQHDRPGSLLVFPEYDSRAGHVTVLTVTNTNASASPIQIIYKYIDASDCLLIDRREVMTPNDTLSVSVGQHNPNPSRGFVYVYAERPTDDLPVSHDFLIGIVTHLDGITARAYSMNAISFQSPQLPGALTDLDADGVRDLDGLEYSQCADELHVPHFFGQSPDFASTEIILIALVGRQFKSRVDFVIFNDNEQVFTARTRMRCWSKGPIAAISPAFQHAFLAASVDDPGEILPQGRESGWFRIDGFDAQSPTTTILDPAILAVLVDPATLPSSLPPFLFGAQSNGDLLPNGAAGDP